MNAVYGNANLGNVEQFPLGNYPITYHGNDITNTQALFPLSKGPQIPAYGFPNVSDLERDFRESSIRAKSPDGTAKPAEKAKTANIKVESEAHANINLMPTASHSNRNRSNYTRTSQDDSKDFMPLEGQGARKYHQKASKPHLNLEDVCPCTLQGHSCMNKGQYALNRRSI